MATGALRQSTRPCLLTTALIVLAVTMMLGLAGASAVEGLLAWDVRFAYVPAAEALLEGRSPYPALDDPILDDQKGYVYPPQLLIAVLPLTFLPVDVVAVTMALGMLALLGLTLYVLGTRDARCYAITLLSLPAASGVLFANLSIPLALVLALVWRYRTRVWPPAVALGLAVSAKLLLWPVFVWTLAKRQYRTTVLALAIGAVTTFAAWAAIGFAGLTGYPALLRRLSEIQAANSYSFVGMSAELGLGVTVGRVVTLVVGGALLAWCAVLARGGDDERSFTCAVAATLALSPIVWLHYLVLLVVPLAIMRPRFSAVWLIPLLLWASPEPGHANGVQTFFPGLAAVLLVVVLLTRPPATRSVTSAEAPA